MAEDPRLIDPVTLTVIDNFLTSTCRDMGVTMMKTSYSPIFNESLDFSCVIFDPEGQMLAQAEGWYRSKKPMAGAQGTAFYYDLSNARR